MEAVNFNEDLFKVIVGYSVEEVPEFFRIHKRYQGQGHINKGHGLPTLLVKFNLSSQTEYWRRQPDEPLEIRCMPQYHISNTKSFDLKLCPSQYSSPDVLYNVLEENLKKWADYDVFDHNDVTHVIITRIHQLVDYDVATGANCQYLELIVHIKLKLEYVLDERLQGNGGMVPATKTSIMQLPERMEIDDDQSLNDHDCAICLEQLAKEGKKLLCMPCSHMFHGDCITTWLNKSHYCPICRHDMPITQ